MAEAAVDAPTTARESGGEGGGESDADVAERGDADHWNAAADAPAAEGEGEVADADAGAGESAGLRGMLERARSQRKFELNGAEIDLNQLVQPVFSSHLEEALAMLILTAKQQGQQLAFLEQWSHHLEDLVEKPDDTLMARATAMRLRTGFAPWKAVWTGSRRGSRVRARALRQRHASELLRDMFDAWRWSGAVSAQLESALLATADVLTHNGMRVWNLRSEQMRRAAADDRVAALRTEGALLRSRVNTATAALQAEQSAHQQTLLMLQQQVAGLDVSRKQLEQFVIQQQAEDEGDEGAIVVHKDDDADLFTTISRAFDSAVSAAAPADEAEGGGGGGGGGASLEVEVGEPALHAPSPSALRTELLTSANTSSSPTATDGAATLPFEPDQPAVAQPGSAGSQLLVLASALGASVQCATGVLRMVDAAGPSGGFGALGDSMTLSRAVRMVSESVAATGGAAASQIEGLSIVAARADSAASRARLLSDDARAERCKELARSAARFSERSVTAATEASDAAERLAACSVELAAYPMRLASERAPASEVSMHARAFALAATAASAAGAAIGQVISATRVIAVEHATTLGGPASLPASEANAALEQAEQAMGALRMSANRARATAGSFEESARAGEPPTSDGARSGLEQTANAARGAAASSQTARDTATRLAGASTAPGAEAPSPGASTLRHRPVPASGGGAAAKPARVGSGGGSSARGKAAARPPPKPVDTARVESMRPPKPEQSGAKSGGATPTGRSHPEGGRAKPSAAPANVALSVPVSPMGTGAKAARWANAHVIQSFDETSVQVQTADGLTQSVPITAEIAQRLAARAEASSEASRTPRKGRGRATADSLLQSDEFVSELKVKLGAGGGAKLDPALLVAMQRVADRASSSLDGEVAAPAGSAGLAAVPGGDGDGASVGAIAALARLETVLARFAPEIRTMATGGPRAVAPAELPPGASGALDELPLLKRRLEAIRSDVDGLLKRVPPTGPAIDDAVRAAEERVDMMSASMKGLRQELEARIAETGDSLHAFKESEALVDQSLASRLERLAQAPSASEMAAKAATDGDLSGIANAVAQTTSKLLMLQEELDSKTGSVREDLSGVFAKLAETEAKLPELRSHVDSVQSELLRKLANSEDLQRSLQEDMARLASKEALELLDNAIASAVKEEDFAAFKELLQEEVGGVQLSNQEIAKRADMLAHKLDEVWARARPDTGGSAPPPPHPEVGALLGVVVQCCRAIDQVVETQGREQTAMLVQPESNATIKKQFMPAIVGKGSRIKQQALLKTMLHQRFKQELDAIARTPTNSPPPTRPPPRLTDVYIYGDDGKPYRASLNVEVRKGDPALGRRGSRGMQQRRSPRSRVGLVAPATSQLHALPAMQLANQSSIESSGLSVAMPTVMSGSPAATNPLGRRAINPITPYELWGLKNPSLNKKRATSLAPLAAGTSGSVSYS